MAFIDYRYAATSSTETIPVECYLVPSEWGTTMAKWRTWRTIMAENIEKEDSMAAPKEAKSIDEKEREAGLKSVFKKAKKLYTEGVSLTNALRSDIEAQESWKSKVDKEHMKLAMYLYNNVSSDVWHKAMEAFDVPATEREKIADIAIKRSRIDSSLSLPVGAFIVILTNPNSHTYTLGKPYRVYGVPGSYSDTCIDEKGWKGNHAPRDQKAIRPATNEEIAGFVARYVCEELSQDLLIATSEIAKDIKVVNFLETLVAGKTKEISNDKDLCD
jgi:hypothetical protein